MPATNFKLLCTGDVHLGRRPSRVPVDEDGLSVQWVWDRFVEAALNQEVDAVVLTGDLVDSENQMYEAYGALERGVQRLLDGDIDIVAVAGNHDHDAFPRLVRGLNADGLHLLGAGGTWEAVEIAARTGTSVRFVGWSFPQATVHTSPLDDLKIAETDAPTIGVLHCEAGSGEGQYAPVRRDALTRAPVDAWLLGHIHAPTDHREAGQLQLYPGSLQPLDPGEPGPHGPWRVDVGPTAVAATQRPLASLRYNPVSLSVTDLDTAEDIEAHIFQTVREDLAARVAPGLAHVAYRLVVEGRTQLHREIEALTSQMRETLQVAVDGTTATIEEVALQTRPDYDLEALARSNDPPGVLARVLLRLERGDLHDDDVQTLLRRASKAAATVHASSRYEPLRHDSATREPPARDDLRSLLYTQGLLLLDALHARRS